MKYKVIWYYNDKIKIIIIMFDFKLINEIGFNK